MSYLTYRLARNECPVHMLTSVSLDRAEDGATASGTRLTSGKCCGRWHETESWPMKASALRSAAEIMLNAAAMLEEDSA